MHIALTTTTGGWLGQQR